MSDVVQMEQVIHRQEKSPRLSCVGSKGHAHIVESTVADYPECEPAYDQRDFQPQHAMYAWYFVKKQVPCAFGCHI